MFLSRRPDVVNNTAAVEMVTALSSALRFSTSKTALPRAEQSSDNNSNSDSNAAEQQHPPPHIHSCCVDRRRRCGGIYVLPFRNEITAVEPP